MKTPRIRFAFTSVLLMSAFILCGCLTTPAPGARKKPVEQPRIHNMAPAFLDFWSRVESKPVEEQLRLLKTEFFPKFPEFYSFKIEKWKKLGKNPDEELVRHLKEFPQIRTEFAKKTKEITNNLNSTMTSFIESVPGLDQNFDIYITHSFGEMDGGTRKIGEKIYFILGIDGMVKYHQGFESEIPFFHHELFHIYHGQYLPEEQVMWIALWAEGLATYASEKLNPGASLKDLMLDLPPGMVQNINNRAEFHWADLSTKLSSREDSDYESYFLMSSSNKKIVTRAGYYLGYLLAKEIGKTKTVPEMAQLKPYEIQSLLKETIEKMRRKKP